MTFPDLETMIKYGIYTIKDLIMYSHNKLVKRNINILNECNKCCFVYEGKACSNCKDIKNSSLV